MPLSRHPEIRKVRTFRWTGTILTTRCAVQNSYAMHCLLQRDPTPSKETRALIDWIVAEAQLTGELRF